MSFKIHELREKRAALVAEMRSLTERPEGQGGDLSDGQERRFAEAKAEVAALERQIERQAFLDEADRRAAGVPVAGGDDRLAVECRRVSVLDAIALACDLPGRDVGRIRELQPELAKRAGLPIQGVALPLESMQERRTITTAAPEAGAGGHLIGTDHRPDQFVDLLRDANPLTRLGVRNVQGLVGDVAIPRQIGAATAYWVGEGETITPSDLAFGQIRMSPKIVAAMAGWSRSMVLQATPDIDAIARRDLADRLGRALAMATIKGGGANEPTGVIGTSGLGTVDISGGLTWAKVLEFVEKIELANASAGGWLTTPSMVKALRSAPKEVDGSDVAVSADYLMDGPAALAGYPLVSSNLAPATLGSGGNEHALLFGDWSDVLIGSWGVLDILANPYATGAYEKGLILVRAMLHCDVAIRHAESFVLGRLAVGA
ncbi:major capsid protein HK97 [Desulfarculus baarsii DSM 2075]|uniref:Major capsid protein HK97 n=1 Tax=Desulfarculus baarsii (strain ATCC 33931 / DSM 2075 / LMG 7858 / VKM B-1802 / 2st14) TaxID=644282 RepID=E1QHP0_DESB2|nr:phage major capsid protein [Desulfarculus baarsii]ADK85083.1 major capsid protein HK97 [Desulfarculus baarsii DSM 2075]